MRARPGHIHLSTLSRRELSRRRRRRWLAGPGGPVLGLAVVAEAALVLAVWAERLVSGL